MEKTLSILVVEDDVSWQHNYEEVLSEKGYHVDIASSLNEALEALDRRFYHAAIVDLRLDEKNTDNREGMGVLRRIWELNEGTGAIVVSIYADISMFEEFRKYGVFGLTEKLPSTPEDAVQEFKSLSFIKGGIDKGKSGISSSLTNYIMRAADEAQRASVQMVWSRSPFGFINGILARDILLSMGGGQMLELETFLRNLCHPFMPWLQAKEIPIDIKIDEQCIGYQTPCWSRALGEAILVRFVRRASFKSASELTPVDSVNHFGKIGKELRHTASSHFEGIVYHLEDINFRQHFKLPAPRRTIKLH